MATWTSHPTFYNEMPREIRAALETAIWAASLGYFDLAEDTFDCELLCYDKHPLVILERANLYERMGLCLKRLEILGQAIPPDERKTPRTGADIWDLLELLRYHAEIHTYARLFPALRFCSKLCSRLSQKPIRKYEDVEIHCAVVCHRIILDARNTSNWLSQPDMKDAKNFNTLTEIRQTLTMDHRQGELVPYLYIVREADFRGSIPAAYEEFFASLNDVDQKDDITAFKIAELRLYYAEELARHGRRRQATEVIDIANVAFRSMYGNNARPHLEMLSEYAHIACCLNPAFRPIDSLSGKTSTNETSFNKCISAMQTSLDSNNFGMYRRFVMLANDLCSQMPIGRSQRTKETMRSVLAKAIQVEEGVTGALFFVALFLLNYVDKLGGNQHAGVPGLSHIMESFYLKAADSDIPLLTHVFALMGRMSHNLGSSGEILAQYDVMARESFQNLPTLSNMSIDSPDVDDKYFFSLWHDGSFGGFEALLQRWRRTCSTLLHRWVIRELHDGELSATDSMKLLRWETLSGSQSRALELQQSCDRSKALQALRAIPTADLDTAVFGNSEPWSNADWGSWFEHLSKWLRLPGRVPSSKQRLLLLKEIQHCRVLTLQFDGHKAGTRSQNVQRFRSLICESSRLLATTLSVQEHLISPLDVPFTQYQLASYIVSLVRWTSSEEAQKPDAEGELLFAIDNLEEVATIYEKLCNISQALFARITLAEAWKLRYEVFESAAPWDCLSRWLETERLYQILRLEHIFLTPEQGFTAKRLLATSFHQASHMRLAIMAVVNSLQISQDLVLHQIRNWNDPPSNEALKDHLVSFTQMMKARATTDMISVVCKPPSAFLRLLDSLPEATRLWKERGNLQFAATDNLPISETLSLRQRFLDYTQRLREFPLIQPYIDLQAGVVMSKQEIIDLSSHFPPNVVFVEWIELVTEFRFALLLYQQGELKHWMKLNCSLSTVGNWISAQLDQAEDNGSPTLNGRFARQALDELCGLVQPLKKLTESGTALVFCPTGLLHRIPLHAIRVSKGARSVIERNPVVYTQSLSLLRLCHGSLHFQPDEPQDFLRATIFNTLERFRSADDESATLKAIDNVGKLLNAEVIQPSEHAKQNFKDLCSQSNIIHVHGHADFSLNPEPTQHLNLREPVRSQEDTVTAKEVFDLKLRSPSLVLAMGCNTGRADISEANDLLGLTTAFHVAGASTVVSTLWKIDRMDCIQFATAFYQAMRDQNQDLEFNSPPEAVTDLAKAFQTATVSLMRTEGEEQKARKPYHWAGFTLHGAWLWPKLNFQF